MSNIKIYLLLTWPWVWMLLWISAFKICHPLSSNVSGWHWRGHKLLAVALSLFGAGAAPFLTAPARSKPFRRLRLRLRANRFGGSGSGSEQTVSAAPAPAPSKMCQLLRLRLRIPGSIPCQSCSICYPGKFFLARIKGLQYFITGTSFTEQQLYSRHLHIGTQGNYGYFSKQNFCSASYHKKWKIVKTYVFLVVA